METILCYINNYCYSLKVMGQMEIEKEHVSLITSQCNEKYMLFVPDYQLKQYSQSVRYSYRFYR